LWSEIEKLGRSLCNQVCPWSSSAKFDLVVGDLLAAKVWRADLFFLGVKLAKPSNHSVGATPYGRASYPSRFDISTFLSVDATPFSRKSGSRERPETDPSGLIALRLQLPLAAA